MSGEDFLVGHKRYCSNLQSKPCVAQEIQAFTRTAIVQTHQSSLTCCYDVLLSSSCVAKDCCLDAKMNISLKLPKGYWFSNSWIRDVVSQPRSACTNKMFEQTSSPSADFVFLMFHTLLIFDRCFGSGTDRSSQSHRGKASAQKCRYHHQQ